MGSSNKELERWGLESAKAKIEGALKRIDEVDKELK